MKRLPEEDLRHVLAHCGPVFEELRGADIFITGGTGFFGLWLVETLLYADSALQLDSRMVLLTRDAARFGSRAPHLAGDARVTLVEGDVRSFEYHGRCSHLIHAATDASASLNENAPQVMFDVVLEGTRRVVHLLDQLHPRRVLYVSSGAVYGVQPPELANVSEEYPGAPDCLNLKAAYGNAKRVAEWVMLAGANGREVTVARPFAFVGPHLPLDTHFAAGNFLADGLAGRTLKIGGDGTPYRSYLHAADLAIWLWTLLVRGEHGRAYNVGSDEAVSIAELANVIAWEAGGLPVEIAREPVPGVLPSRYVPDVERARQELGLDVWILLPEAIRRTLSWLRN